MSTVPAIIQDNNVKEVLKELNPSKAKMIEGVFAPFAAQLAGFEDEYLDILATKEVNGITPALTKIAKNLRNRLVKVRTGADKARKAQKAEFLQAGKAIDGVANIVKWAVSDKENVLAEIEKHFENLEKERLQALQEERVEAISKYIEDAGERNLSSMEADVWESYFSTKKSAYEDRIAAEAKAEHLRVIEARLDEIESNRERKFAEYKFLDQSSYDFRTMSEDEYKALMTTLEEQKKAHFAEKAKAKAEAKAALIKQQEAEKKLIAEKAKAKAEAAKERAAFEAKIRAAEEEKKALIAKEKAREAAKAKEIAEVKAAEQRRIEAEKAKGDTGKIEDLKNELTLLKEKYSFKSKKNQVNFAKVCDLLNKAIETL